jgi:peptidyl-prolyl cis-trans isomerase B (cyclophilin B)
MRRLIPLPIVLVTLALAGCGSDDGGTTAAIPSSDASAGTTPAAATTTAASTPSADNAVTVATKAPGTCKTVSDPGPKKAKEQKPTTKLKAGVNYTVTLRTSCGSIPILLDQGRQPKTAASFAHLVKDGFFDHLTFHRIVPGFVIQGGDPKGTGTGGPGYSITETPPEEAAYTRGIVAMAKSGADPAGRSGSQFFIVTGDDARLPADYAIVGKVTGDGMTVADAISAVKTDPTTDRPVKPVMIEKATLTEG